MVCSGKRARNFINLFSFLDSNAVEKLKSLSPAQTDVEFRTLSPDAGGDMSLMLNMFDLFMVSIETGKDFELIQAYVALFLKVGVFQRISF